MQLRKKTKTRNQYCLCSVIVGPVSPRKQPECLPLGPTRSLSVVVELAVVGSKAVIRDCPTVREFLNDDEYLLDEEMLKIPYYVRFPPAYRFYALVSAFPDTTQQDILAQMTRILGASQHRTV